MVRFPLLLVQPRVAAAEAARKVHLGLRVRPVLAVLPVHLAQQPILVLLVQPATLVTLVRRVQPAKQARYRVPLVTPVIPDRPVQLDHQALLLVRPDQNQPVRPAQLVYLDQLRIPVQRVQQARAELAQLDLLVQRVFPDRPRIPVQRVQQDAPAQRVFPDQLGQQAQHQDQQVQPALVQPVRPVQPAA